MELAGKLWGDKAAGLAAGDLVFFTDDLVTSQVARVHPSLTVNPDGSYTVGLREFDINAYHEGTATTDTLPSTGQAWASSTAPTLVNINYNYGGAEYSMIGGSASDGTVYVGNSARVAVLDGSDIVLPNSVPLYGENTSGGAVGLIMVNGSNEIQLGDGSYPIYCNSPSILLPDFGSVAAGHGSSPYNLVSFSNAVVDYVHVGSSAAWTVVEGSGANGVTIMGGGCQFYFSSGNSTRYVGYSAGTAAAPSYSDTLDWGFYLDTVNGDLGCFMQFPGGPLRVG